MKLHLPALVVFCCLAAGVQSQQSGRANWFKKHAHAIDSSGSHFTDLQFLKPLLKNKRVVLLGESSHGAGNYYALKSRLVEFLYREMDFEVIAMESGIADIYLRYCQTDTLSPAALRNSTVFGNFQCREILPLFQLIKSSYNTQRPLIYAGFDSQNFQYSRDFLKEIMAVYDTGRAARVYHDLYKYYQISRYLWQEDKTPLFHLSDTVIAAAQNASALINEKEAEIQQRYNLTSTGMAVIKRGIHNYMQSMQLDWNRDNPGEKRDSLMANNICWLMDSLYPGKKIIIWAHNGHIGKTSTAGSAAVWMGERLRKRLGNQAYHIGIFAGEGRLYEWWTRTEKPFVHSQPGQLEHYLAAAKQPVSFINIEGLTPARTNKWLFEPVQAFEPENGGLVQFVPVQRFDGLIYFQLVRPPLYDK